MGARSSFLHTSLFLSLLLAAGAGCAKSDSVGDTFQNLGGSGGNGVGGGDQGGAGAGVTTTGTPTGETTTSSGSTTGGTTSSTTSDTTTTTTTTPTCSDGPNEGEPNNSEATAKNLGVYSDCDDFDQPISGVLNGPDDEDWFKYEGLDEFGFGCTVYAAREIDFMSPARVCQFAQCTKTADTPSVGCPSGTSPTTSPQGRPGCCHSTSFTMDIDCDGTDDGAFVYIRIDNPNQSACIPYTLKYHY